MSRSINTICWIAITIGKHVVAQQALAGGDKSIGIDESTDLGIVITGLEVVQLRILGSQLAIRAKMADHLKEMRPYF